MTSWQYPVTFAVNAMRLFELNISVNLQNRQVESNTSILSIYF